MHGFKVNLQKKKKKKKSNLYDQKNKRSVLNGVRAMPDQEAARISSYFVQKLWQCQYIEESGKGIKYQWAY